MYTINTFLCKLNIRHLKRIAVKRQFSSTCCVKVKAKMPNTTSDEPHFHGTIDRFRGTTIDTETEPCHHSVFLKKLNDSIKHWSENHIRAVWFRVAHKDASLVPILAESGFQYHHAREGFVMMYRWISDTEACRIPPYAHTMIGSGAVVINSKNEVLLVKEKHFFIPKYKLPGGYVDIGENLIDAAQREVFEETNIKTKYNSLVCFRHSHNANFNSSDLYFMMYLTALNEDIKIDKMEITDAIWMDLDEVLKSDIVSEHNQLILQTFLDNKKHCLTIKHDRHVVELLNKPYLLYTMQQGKSSLDL